MCCNVNLLTLLRSKIEINSRYRVQGLIQYLSQKHTYALHRESIFGKYWLSETDTESELRNLNEFRELLEKLE